MTKQRQQTGGRQPDRSQTEVVRMLRSKVARLERANAEHRQIEEAYRALVDHSAQGLAIIQDARVVFANQKMAGITGYSVDELKAMPAEEVRALIHPEDRKAFWSRHRDRMVGKSLTDPCEFRLIRGDGILCWLQVCAGRMMYQGHAAVQAAYVDITERKRAEQNLREQMQLNQVLLDAMPCVALLMQPKTREIVASNEAARAVGAVAGTTCFGTWAQSESPCPWCLAPEVWATGEPRHLEVEAAGIVWDTHWLPVSEDLYMHYAFDITERGRIAKTVEHMARFPSENPYPVIRVSKDGIVLFTNPASVELLRGLKSGLNLAVPTDWMPRIHESLASGQVLRMELTHRDRIFAFRLVPIPQAQYVNFYGTDITERREAERKAERRQAELIHAGRLSTLGEMASGLAHELNQPLFTVHNLATACLRLAEADGPDMGRIFRNLEKIVGQAERAADIMGRIRAFAQRRQPQLISVDLNQAVASAVDLLSWEIRQKVIDVNLELDDQLPPARADAVQIEQVLLNLARNAVEAMEEAAQEPRRLTIRTRASEEGTVRIEVSDTGVGLPNDDVECVFDAFFTTKADGLGIGLSISRTIMEMHNGTLEARRNAERGSTFVAVLPAIGIDHCIAKEM